MERHRGGPQVRAPAARRGLTELGGGGYGGRMEERGGGETRGCAGG